MKYKIFEYSFTKDASAYEIERYYNETSTHRVIGHNRFVTLLSESQLKYYGKRWEGLDSVHQFEILDNTIQKLSFFEKFIFENYNLQSYNELKEQEKESKIFDTAIQLHEFSQLEKTKHVFKRSTSEKRYCNFVYLLKEDEIVVYVGQSINISRPWEHTDKEWDNVEIIEVPLRFNLNLIERLYIEKYKPKYNKGIPFSTSILKESIKIAIELQNERT